MEKFQNIVEEFLSKNYVLLNFFHRNLRWKKLSDIIEDSREIIKEYCVSVKDFQNVILKNNDIFNREFDSDQNEPIEALLILMNKEEICSNKYKYLVKKGN